MKFKAILFLLLSCFSVWLYAQKTLGLTPDQVKQLQEYALRKGLKLDFSKASVDSLEYEVVERRIDSIALLPGKLAMDDLVSKKTEFFLLMQAQKFTRSRTPILEKNGVEVDVFSFRSYLVRDASAILKQLAPEVSKEMRALRIMQSWPVNKLEEEYRGRGVNPHSQEMMKVLARTLGSDFELRERPGSHQIALTYRSQPLYLILDNPGRVEQAVGDYLISTWDSIAEEGLNLKEFRFSEYVLPMLRYSVDYTLKNLQWIILAEVDGDYALLLIGNEIPHIRLKGE